jgi:hypothetical protein
LQNVDVFSILHLEKPTALLSFSNVEERKKCKDKTIKIKIMTSKSIIEMVLVKKRAQVGIKPGLPRTILQHATKLGFVNDTKKRALIRVAADRLTQLTK